MHTSETSGLFSSASGAIIPHVGFTHARFLSNHCHPELSLAQDEQLESTTPIPHGSNEPKGRTGPQFTACSERRGGNLSSLDTVHFRVPRHQTSKMDNLRRIFWAQLVKRRRADANRRSQSPKMQH